MAYGDFKDINRRTAAEKVLHDKAFNIAKDPKYDGYQRGIASMVYKFFIKTSGWAARLANKFAIKMKLFLIKNWQKNYINQLLKNLKKEKYTDPL